MAFRDDHDAALARADALQRELDDAEEARAEAEADRDQTEQELVQAQQELAELRAEAEAAPKPKPKRKRKPKPKPKREQTAQRDTPVAKYGYTPTGKRRTRRGGRTRFERIQHRAILVALGISFVLFAVLIVLIVSAR